VISEKTGVPKIEHLRDVERSERKQSPFIIADPCDERDARNFPLLDERLRIIQNKCTINTGKPGERNGLLDG
jgi:hypothetical protein